MEETEIKKNIIRRLNLIPGCWAASFNASQIGSQQMVPKGCSDILCCYRGKFIAIECKKPGKKQSVSQVVFEEKIRRAGGKYILATDWETVAKEIR